MREQIIGQENNNNSVTNNVVMPMTNNNIKGFIRLSIIVSSGVMSIIFIISWILWLTLFYTKINEIINIINSVISDQGITFNLTFQTLTIIVLTFAIVTLVVVTFPFIFLKKKSITTLILALVMLIMAALLITVSILLGIFGYCNIHNYVSNYTNIVDILFFVIPSGLEIFCCVILVIFCLLLIFTSFKNKQKTIELQNDTINQEQEYDSLAVDNKNVQSMLQFPETSTQTATYFEPKKTVVAPTVNYQPVSIPPTEHQGQGINITINNNPNPTQNLPPLFTSNTPILNQSHTPTFSPPTNNQTLNQPLHYSQVENKNKMPWSAWQIENVWNKGEIIPNFNPSLYRKDYAGALMYKNSFLNYVQLNDEIKNLNWTIAYQKPLSAGGTNDISNLVPLNNNNALSKSNNYPKWKTIVTHNGKENIFIKKSWKVKK